MDYAAILNEAHEAATAAIAAKFANGDREAPYNCGFAWVTISGRTALTKHCKAAIKAAGGESRAPRTFGGEGYPSGWQFWKPGVWPTSDALGFTVYGQDMDFHQAGAIAFNAVLAKHGIEGKVGTRLD